MSQAAAAASAPAGGNKKLIIIAATVVLLAAIGGGVAVMLKGGDKKAEAAEHAEKEVVHEPVYIDIKPEFVINFANKAGHSKYLKCELSVVTKDPEIEKAVEKHLPAIRNALVLLLSRQIYEELMPNEGKEKLRADALAAVQEVLKAQTGKPGIEDLFFSNFVMH
ncbi:MAG: flagellar basal body-associated FliL family protein [Proteobacteria bacterium]|nr:flagellar basal body-associated FliL family protein [Pseudomonadota bacterium]